MEGHGRSTEGSVAECQARCAAAVGCSHFTYLRDGSCHLQDAGATLATKPRPGAIAGPPACEGQSPLSTEEVGELFSRVHRAGPAAPGSLFWGRKVPLPTGAWWEDLALADVSDFEGSAFQMPYVVSIGQGALHVMQPLVLDISDDAVSEGFSRRLGLTLGVDNVEGLAGPSAASWDELSLTLAWTLRDKASAATGAGLRIPVVRGSPYITAEYTGVTPVLTSQQTLRANSGSDATSAAAEIKVDNTSVVCDGRTSLRGLVFALDFKESDSTWLFFSPNGTDWVCIAEPFSLAATAPLQGTVRIALAKDCTTGASDRCSGTTSSQDATGYTELLRRHAGSYPAGAAVDFAVAADVGAVRWAWNVRYLAGWGREPLLQLAWPVHLPLLPGEVREAAAANPASPFNDIRGPAVAVVGDAWELRYELFPDVGLRAPRPVAESFRGDLLKALRGPGGALWNRSAPDRDFDLPLAYRLGVGDAYSAGKMIARMARLVAIADELGESDETYFSEMVKRLSRRLDVWLGREARAPFLYDASWGGILHCGCTFNDCIGTCTPRCTNRASEPEHCPALKATTVNFGNGFYSNHHAHYGYFVYAAAVVAKFNSTWERHWRSQILALARDYGNPSREDPNFPVARHKDWFLGLSWDGGVVSARGGRYQASSSEALGAYYALYAYGASVDAPFAKRLRDYGRLLAAMESHSANMYLHVRENSHIFKQGFRHSLVGVLSEHGLQHRTLDSEEASYAVGGSQLLSFTPVMETCLGEGWVAEHLGDCQASCDAEPACVEAGYSWPLCLERAVLDPIAAHSCLGALPEEAFSPGNPNANGNSLTNSLHWLATRPRAAPGTPAPPAVLPPAVPPPAVPPPAAAVPSPPPPPAAVPAEAAETAAATSTTGATGHEDAWTSEEAGPEHSRAPAFALSPATWSGLEAVRGPARPSARRPLSTEDPRSLFPAAARKGHAFTPGPALAGRTAPLPTNAWWENLAVGEPATQESNIFQMPYVVLADAAGVHVMHPYNVGKATQGFDKNLGVSFGSVEPVHGPTAARWDELSLDLAWSGDGGAVVKVPLVRGSPYVTAEFAGATPRFTSPQTLRLALGAAKPTVEVDGQPSPCNAGHALEGRVFSFSFTESGTNWVLFAPQATTWTCQVNPFGLTASAPLHGAVRVALSHLCSTGGTGVQPCPPEQPVNDRSAYTQLLARHAGSYPVSASVDYAVKGDVGAVKWEWRIKTLRGWHPAPLLQLAWPVHVPLLPDETLPGIASPFQDVRGKAVAIVGDTWELRYDLPPDVGLRAPRSVEEGLRPQMLQALRGTQGALWNGSSPDRDFDLPLNYRLAVGDTYFSGKLLARLARLVVIADEIGESKEPYFIDMVERLAQRLEAWLKPQAKTPFVYDATWGGLLSCGCNFDDCGGNCEPHCTNAVDPPELCPGLSNAGMNFGNGIYNDHHFHYGYFVYSAAVLAKYHQTWERRWRQHLLAIVRDYGNPSSEDDSFPVARHKDWFLGFSWAGGIKAMVNGRNQESTSESINAYYALYAYGAEVDAPFARDLRDAGRLLTAMEMHGANVYWHIRPETNIFGTAFPHPVVGILWDHAVTFQTWFGGASYIVSGIQLLPFTPVMEDFLQPDWVAQDFAAYRTECANDPMCVKNGWSWPVCLEQAVLDTEGALACLRRLPRNAFAVVNAAASGNSLTNSLHWIATRPRPLGEKGRRNPTITSTTAGTTTFAEQGVFDTNAFDIASSFTTTATTTMWLPGPMLYCFLVDTAYHPLDLPEHSQSLEKSAEACQQRCAAVAPCAHFTFMADGACHLQPAFASSVPATGAIAGPAQCPALKLQSILASLRASGAKTSTEPMVERWLEPASASRLVAVPGPGATEAPSPGGSEVAGNTSSVSCRVGEEVHCPGLADVLCRGDQCCPDGSTCPSAAADFSLCQKPKAEDCTGYFAGSEGQALDGVSNDTLLIIRRDGEYPLAGSGLRGPGHRAQQSPASTSAWAVRLEDIAPLVAAPLALVSALVAVFKRRDWLCRRSRGQADRLYERVPPPYLDVNGLAWAPL